MQDAEIILEYAIEQFVLQKSELFGGSKKSKPEVKIMVHGESLGGMAASYVAMKSNSGMIWARNIPVDFAFIDRTYASLDNVAYWSAGIVALLPLFSDEDGKSSKSKTCCYIDRQRFARSLGKFVSRLFRLVTLWKDNNFLTFAGIERSKTKYILLGSDPVNDNIIFDQASMKNANARTLIYNRLGIPSNARSKYTLNLRDYILKSNDLQEMSSLLEQWAVTIKDLKYLLLNAGHIYGDQDASSINMITEAASNAPILSRNKTLTQQTEDIELVAQKYAELHDDSARRDSIRDEDIESSVQTSGPIELERKRGDSR